MKKRNRKIYNDPWERDFYETGSTRPPKDRGSTVAVLLVLVILVGSLCSGLGVINLQLLLHAAEQNEATDTLNVFEDATHDSQPVSIGESAHSIVFPHIGLTGQTVSDFDRRFYELPQGVLVTGVEENHRAQQAGIHAGDVIIAFGNHLIQSQEDLLAALSACAGQSARVEFYRHQTGKQMYVNITVEEE